MVVDDFIGRKFGKDGHLEVVGWDGSRTGGDKKYTVLCHTCAKDAVLFGNGEFKAAKASLVAGSLPCGCAKTVYWTREQYETRVKRKCDEVGYEFIGFSGEWSGASTKLSLLCQKDGNMWSSTSISNLLYGFGCPICGNASISARLTKTDSTMIRSFENTGNFREGTKFWRSHRKTKSGSASFWNYTCPKCSNDEFAEADLCTGIFEAYSGSLQAGQMSCRCSSTYRWTKRQREYQINKTLTEEGKGVTFIGWKDGFNGSNSRVLIECGVHGVWDTTVTNLLAHGGNCSGCAKYGFDRSKNASVYVLRVEGPSGDFTGYGISNLVEVRLSSHKFQLSKHGFTITDSVVFHMSGQKALDIEYEIKENFPANPQVVMGFKRESTQAHLFLGVVDFIKLNTTKENHVSL